MELEAEERGEQAEWEREERRQEAKRRHKEKMDYMFLNIFREVMGRPGTDTPTPIHPSDQTSDTYYQDNY